MYLPSPMCLRGVHKSIYTVYLAQSVVLLFYFNFRRTYFSNVTTMLNLLVITLNFGFVAMLVIVDLQIMYHTKCVGSPICWHTFVSNLTSGVSFIIAINQKVNIFARPYLLGFHCKKILPRKLHIFPTI